jgi:hypothetical protein
MIDIFVLGNSVRDITLNIHEIADYLSDVVISDVHCDTHSLELHTEHCNVKWVPYSAKYVLTRGRRADIVYGFSDDETVTLRKDHKLIRPEMSLQDCIIFIENGYSNIKKSGDE